jgi:hypothetical protein
VGDPLAGLKTGREEGGEDAAMLLIRPVGPADVISGLEVGRLEERPGAPVHGAEDNNAFTRIL